MNGLKRGAIGLLGTCCWLRLVPPCGFGLHRQVNNYVNKVTLQLAIDSPELLTYLGAIDNTLTIFTAVNWPTTPKKKRTQHCQTAQCGRASMITDQGLVRPRVTDLENRGLVFDDQLRQQNCATAATGSTRCPA